MYLPLYQPTSFKRTSPYSKTYDIQINKQNATTNNITNSKIVKSPYINIDNNKYDTPVHYDSINSKTTNNKQHNNNHDTIYSTKTTKNTQQNNTKISPLENKSKLAIHKYRSKINKHISTIESRINKKLKNNKHRTQDHETQKPMAAQKNQPPQFLKKNAQFTLQTRHQILY